VRSVHPSASSIHAARPLGNQRLDRSRALRSARRADGIEVVRHARRFVIGAADAVAVSERITLNPTSDASLDLASDRRHSSPARARAAARENAVAAASRSRRARALDGAGPRSRAVGDVAIELGGDVQLHTSPGRACAARNAVNDLLVHADSS